MQKPLVENGDASHRATIAQVYSMITLDPLCYYTCRFCRNECFVGFQDDTPAAVVYLASKQREQTVTGPNWECEVCVIVLVGRGDFHIDQSTEW